MNVRHVALVGYGEVGQTLGGDLRARDVPAPTAWDRLFVDPASGPSRAAAELGHVHAADGMGTALHGCELVISAVTAGECLAAAREAAMHVAPGAWYFDLNSVSPQTRAQAAAVIEAAGGRYVEAAVMSPIAPRGSASPMLIGGPHAAPFRDVAESLGFTGAEVYSEVVGRASAAKMCRSVMIKGLEALLAESLLAARHYGVEESVLASLQNLLPADDWPALARYMISRSLQHGTRRAEEMEEVARTVQEAGLAPWMSSACVERQRWAAGHRAALGEAELNGLLDAVRAAATAWDEERA